MALMGSAPKFHDSCELLDRVVAGVFFLFDHCYCERVPVLAFGGSVFFFDKS